MVECEECDQSFMTTQALSAHKKTHRPALRCPICQEEFRELQRHLSGRLHTQLELAKLVTDREKEAWNVH